MLCHLTQHRVGLIRHEMHQTSFGLLSFKILTTNYHTTPSFLLLKKQHKRTWLDWKRSMNEHTEVVKPSHTQERKVELGNSPVSTLKDSFLF